MLSGRIDEIHRLTAFRALQRLCEHARSAFEKSFSTPPPSRAREPTGRSWSDDASKFSPTGRKSGENNRMSDSVAGAIVGGTIGFVSALAVAVLSLLFSFRNEAYKRSLAAHNAYVSWLRGLIPECEFLLACLEELRPAFFTTGQVAIPTKRFNYDFLAAARIEIMKHPRSVVLFPKLTAAYRDVVHTNDMMDRLERSSLELHSSTMAEFNFQGLFQSTAACFAPTRTAIEALLAVANEQIQLEADNPPRLLEVPIM